VSSGLTATVAHRSFLNDFKVDVASTSDLFCSSGVRKRVELRSSDEPPEQTSQSRVKGKPCIFDEAAVLEFAEGKVSRVFGQDFAKVDTFPMRVRVPSPPFMALSRITKIEARPGTLEPCSIQTEFTIPNPAWYAVDNLAPYMAVDAQGVLFLLSYIGVDFINCGQRSYRWLDATMTWLGELPFAGETVQYDIQIKSFVQQKDLLLFFTDFHCSVDGRPVLRIDNCCAGFFTEEQLREGKGISATHQTHRRKFVGNGNYPLRCPKTSFTESDLIAVQRGDLVACFGAKYEAHGLNPSLRTPPAPMQMIDRISHVDTVGGKCGLGIVVGEKDIHPDDWFIRSHFKDAPVYAGPCMLEGVMELLSFYALYGGLQTATTDARFQPVIDRPYSVRFRSQIPAVNGTVETRLEIVEAGWDPEPYLVADVDFIYSGKTMGRLQDVGIRLVEKTPATQLPHKG
jgi:3-hydroxymyristoyl/3-hydroxydecanoyl-(acyl carrier protein) dehydratase